MKLGHYTKDHEKEETMPWRVMSGMGWETMCAQLYPEMIWQPGVFTYRGIQGHPDGLSHFEDKPEHCAVNEWKYTAQSLRLKGGRPDQHKDIRSQWVWQCQVMAYIKLISMGWEIPIENIRWGYFHIILAMVAYENHTLDERYIRYLVEYEEREIESNWNLLEAHRDEAMAYELGR